MKLPLQSASYPCPRAPWVLAWASDAGIASWRVVGTISRFASICRSQQPIFRSPNVKIPGKACGSCSFCCKVLEIDELKKTAGDLCEHCARSGGCSVYATRPQVCRDYICDWKEDRELLVQFRPDRVGTLLMGRSRQRRISRRLRPGKAVFLAQSPDIQAPVSLAKEGRVVVAKAGLRSWRIFADGRSQELA